MKFSTEVRPIGYLKSATIESVTESDEAKLVATDVRFYEAHEETLSLLKILALGNHEIEQGQFHAAADVFAALD